MSPNPNNIQEHEAGFFESLAGAAVVLIVEIVIMFSLWAIWKAVSP